MKMENGKVGFIFTLYQTICSIKLKYII